MKVIFLKVSLMIALVLFSSCSASEDASQLTDAPSVAKGCIVAIEKMDGSVSLTASDEFESALTCAWSQ